MNQPQDAEVQSRSPEDDARVLLVDDHAVVIEGLVSTLAGLDGFVVVGAAHDADEALRGVESLRPDIVIMDISMPGMSGIEATQVIKEQFPATRVIVYTMHADREYVLKLFEAGMDGYVLKQDPIGDLLLALDVVSRGGTYFSTQAPKLLAAHLREGGGEQPVESDELALLSERELEVFGLLADGYSVKATATRLFISPKTVESHKYHIMAKLKLNSLTEMTKMAIRLGVISP